MSGKIEENACASCPVHRSDALVKLGVDMGRWDFAVALAGNPNTGKSTVFNNLTGLRQHTGNWPGKTISRAEGGFSYGEANYKLVDLPGTYSLLSTSYDEEIARDFILFGRPDVTVIVVDATRLERNLNLVLQVLEITDRAVVCLNLVDEARRHSLEVDARALARDLGVPVVPTAAPQGEGVPQLLQTIAEVASGQVTCRPNRLQTDNPELDSIIGRLVEKLEGAFPGLPNARWVALRLLSWDERIVEAIRTGELGRLAGTDTSFQQKPSPEIELTPEAHSLLDLAGQLRWEIDAGFLDALMESIYAEAGRIADRAVSREGEHPSRDLDQTLDRLVTSRLTGFPIMLLLLTAVFWLTISGANLPSALLAGLLLDTLHPLLKEFAVGVGLPWWLDGLLIDGMYLSVAWVVSVMLPPMAIFFPLFTLLEDFGYLPRVAFNLDHLFKRAGAHGKQALTMSMGFGCNAAGIIATRVIDSPRERLIAIVTNNFALCNGRWPTQILIASLFIGGLVSAEFAGLVSAAAVVGVTLLGVLLTFLLSWFLSHTVLRGEPSAFSLELPPYRPPRIWQTLYTSLIDRTIFVLWRAVVFALPAGAVIWSLANIHVEDASLAEIFISWSDPFGLLIGLNGVVLLAYIIAVPANEIVIPTVFMLTVLSGDLSGVGEGTGVMFELESEADMLALFQAGGWGLLTAVSLMLFSLVHNPCSTTIYTIWKETRSVRWALVASLLPVVLGLGLCATTAAVWRAIVS